MIVQNREYGRVLDERTNLAEIASYQADPQLVEQAVRQQQLILEQQRLADELQLERLIEHERQFFIERDARQNADDSAGSGVWPASSRELRPRAGLSRRR